MEEKTKVEKRGSFSGGIGYVLSVAGSAVGLGNIWRFPYLAAKYGGGIFLLIYLLFVVTFGYVFVVSETALGRMTKKSPVGAFHVFGSKLPFSIGGWINAVIPMIIVPYYSVIGGWVLKYLFEYIRGNMALLATDGYFSSFISSSWNVELWFIIFSAFVFFTILAGVENGVEKTSKFLMPFLVILAIFVMIYSVTRPGAIEGVKYFLIPNFNNFSWMTVVAAMGQMFYSLSIAMGILYTYGSYMKKSVDIEKSTTQVEFFDTLIALIAGLMIIPAVFSFSNGDLSTLKAGPSLAFITLPKIFNSMKGGVVVAIAFFLMFLLAAATSAISLLETSVSTLQDELKWSRKKATLLMVVVMVCIGSASSFGYGIWSNVRILGMQILDFFDFLTNSIMMPLAALATVILILFCAKLNAIDTEVELSSKFKRKGMYHFILKYLSIAFITIILLSSIANVFGWISI